MHIRSVPVRRPFRGDSLEYRVHRIEYRVEYRDSILDSQHSRVSRIECHLTSGRYCTTACYTPIDKHKIYSVTRRSKRVHLGFIWSVLIECSSVHPYDLYETSMNFSHLAFQAIDSSYRFVDQQSFPKSCTSFCVGLPWMVCAFVCEMNVYKT